MPNERKIQIVSELQQKLQDAKGIIFTSYAGLSVPEISDLRAKLRAAQAEIKVVKNTLLKLALRESPFKLSSDNELTGPTAIVVSHEDEIKPLKALQEFAEEHGALQLKGGFFEGKWTAPAVLAEIAKLPSKDELRVKLVMMLQWPIFRLMNVLKGNQRNLVNVLNQIAKER